MISAANDAPTTSSESSDDWLARAQGTSEVTHRCGRNWTRG